MPFRRTSLMLIALLVLVGCNSGEVTSDDELAGEPEPGEEAPATDPSPEQTEETDIERPSVEETVAAPPRVEAEASDAAETPEGRAELELVTGPETFGRDGQVELRLVNRGEVWLWHGWWVDLQRWTADGWVDAPWPDGVGVDDVSVSLLPGEETHPQRWPGEDAALDRGWYRVSWEARWEDDTGENEPVELRVHASFEVSSPRSSGDEPAWYAEREPMPSCGAFGPDEIALDNVELEEANRCLLEAFENGEPAELQVVLRTEEGDPIVETYRIIAAGELERMVDSRRDDFGNKDFYYAVCTDLYEDRPRGRPTVRVADCVFDEDRTVVNR